MRACAWACVCAEREGREVGDQELVELGIGSYARGTIVPLAKVVFSLDFI